MASEHEKLVEDGAMILEPQAWKVKNKGLLDSVAYENRRTSSLRKSAKFIAFIAERTKEATIQMHQELRRENRKDPEADRAIKTT